jgi:hypothetical protein
VGTYKPAVDASPAVEWVAPQETARFPVFVTNDGDIPDVIKVDGVLPVTSVNTFQTHWDGCAANPTVLGVLTPNPSSCYVALLPGQSVQLRLDVTVPGRTTATGGGAGYPISITAHSYYMAAAAGTAGVTIKILAWQAADVDGDQLEEYAVDDCTVSQTEGCMPNASDGYETFRENLQTGCPGGCGVQTKDLRGVPELEQFLSNKARESWNGAYVVDLDGDQRIDHLLDKDGDGLPDVYWVPATNQVADFTLIRDINADQLPDYFIDLEGDGRWDEVYDLAAGKPLPLIQTYADEGDVPDYVVDANGNHEIDQSETILFGGPNGRITTIQWNADVNGDGLADKAIDANGDDKPDYFFPNGSQTSIPIELKDVTGDGVPDWTYDHTGQGGRPDSYYDPVTGESNPIDTKGVFLHDLAQYWYVVALFALAMVLFIVLVAVTRRR